MTDEKKPDDSIEMDWDSALSDWESKSFVPEIAKDAGTDRPASLSGAPVSRPLYRPPKAPQKPAAPSGTAAPRFAARSAGPPPPAPSAADGGSFEGSDDEADATVIGTFPSELVRAAAPAEPRAKTKGPADRPPPIPPARSGGLGQFFARDERRDAQATRAPRASTRTRTERLDGADTGPPPSSRDEGGVGPLRGPPPFPEGDLPRDDLNPFGESREEQPTLPADDEVEVRQQDGGVLAPLRQEGDAGVPSVLIPSHRKYDPDEETLIGDRADLLRGLSPSQVQSSRPGEHVAVPRERAWDDERPASDWLDDSARDSLRARAMWLEHEARLIAEPVARGRGLLTCSELLATVGDRDGARALAAEARDLAHSIALAHRQARALLPLPSVPEARLEALDLEVKMTPAGPARIHSMLLAADAAAEEGDADGAATRLEQAARIAPSDVRVAIGRAARALAHLDATPSVATPGIRFADGRDLAAVGAALRVCSRLRAVGDTHKEPSGEPNELLTTARRAIENGDLSAAATTVRQLGRLPELATGAMWLAAALAATRGDRRAHAARWLRELVEQGEPQARRPLAARALEIGDPALVTALLTSPLAGPTEGPGSLLPMDRLILATLSPASAPDPAGDSYLTAAAETDEMGPLAAAIAAVVFPSGDVPRRPEHAGVRAKRTFGSVESRAAIEIGRLLGTGASAGDVESAMSAIDPVSPPRAARAVALEIAARTGRAAHVSATLAAWAANRGTAEERLAGALAAAIVAERAGEAAQALRSYQAAREAGEPCECAIRAIASLEHVDMVAEMNALADDIGEGSRAAIARLEAVALGERVLPEPTQAHLLDAAHRAAPALPIAAFLAERIARRSGDFEEVLRWIRDRRAQSTDPIESALHAVREAFLVADREPALAAERLHEAHLIRPADVALRDLFERIAIEIPADRAVWREGRAADAVGDARKLLLLEAALEYERDGDEEGALRCAERAAALDTALGRVARERAELRTGRVARLADELFSQAKEAEEPTRRREAYERLADLDRDARRDPGSAVLWHRSIFEEHPHYEPSLRYLEHHLIGEGRDEELEPIARGIAVALRGTDSPESTAHAELAARLRMRGAAGSWDATREIAEVAAYEKEPSLWALRMLQSHSRANGDDGAFLAVTKRLVDRATQPREAAALLLRAGEAAARLGDATATLTLLERATTHDPGDVEAWTLLARARCVANDRRGAAEATEAVARTSAVPERQLAAWYEAGDLWQRERDARATGDAPHSDENRALAAFEAGATIDVTYKDVFERLSRIYAARKMQAELAELLERRIDCVTDPNERITIEVERGRVLFEAGDIEGARRAYDSALTQRPDDAQALAARTDLCLAQGDWEVAEQSLVRLARLLSTPAEQRVVYAQLGELYSHHLVNLSRAEVALKEVLKYAPDDLDASSKLVDVYKRQEDSARAIALQQELVQKSRSSQEKRIRVVELSRIHEEVAHDNRKAEQTLESARREFPQDVEVLRALAQFYTRHGQTPAVNMLLDRAATDARRALTAGRLASGSFEVLTAVFDLRGRADAARVCQAMLATLEGRPADVRGAGIDAALDVGLDDLLAPEALSAPLLDLLAKTGDALDAVHPVDLRAMKASPVAADNAIARAVAQAADAAGLGNVTLLVSAKLGAVCIPASSLPPTMVMGPTLIADTRIGVFLALRALKLVAARACALGRTVPGELGVLVSAWLHCFNPSFHPQGINQGSLTTAVSRIQGALPRKLSADVGLAALEVATAIGTRQATLGPAALSWANRVAFLALGDANAALDAIASAGSPGAVGVAGPPRTAPRDPKERAAWIARTPEARDLVAFAVTDAFAEARSRVGLSR